MIHLEVAGEERRNHQPPLILNFAIVGGAAQVDSALENSVEPQIIENSIEPTPDSSDEGRPSNWCVRSYQKRILSEEEVRKKVVAEKTVKSILNLSTQEEYDE